MNLQMIIQTKSIRWIISLLLITILLWITDIELILSTIALAKWTWLLMAFGMAMFLTAFGAVKWWVLMPRSRSGPLSFIRVNFISNFVGIFFPGIVGIEASRIAGITQSSKDLSAAIASVLVDRIFGLLSLGLVIAMGGLIVAQLIPISVSIACAVLLAGILAGIILAMNHRFRELLGKLLPQKINQALIKLYECIDLYRERKLTLLISLLLSLVFQLLRVVMVYWLSLSLSIDVQFNYLLIVVPVALFVQMIPLSIYGIGIRESAMISLLSVVGVKAESAFALSILLLAIQIAGAFPGGILFAMGNRLHTPEE